MFEKEGKGKRERERGKGKGGEKGEKRGRKQPKLTNKSKDEGRGVPKNMSSIGGRRQLQAKEVE